MSTYIWIKGENTGNTDILDRIDESEGFTYFKSGRRISNSVFHEFMMPLSQYKNSVKKGNIQKTHNFSNEMVNTGEYQAPIEQKKYNFDSGEDDGFITDEAGNRYNVDEIQYQEDTIIRQQKSKSKSSNSNIGENSAVNGISNYGIDVSQITSKPSVKEESPIVALVKKSKRESTKIMMELEMDIPSKQTIDLLVESFECDFDKDIIDVIIDKEAENKIINFFKTVLKESIYNHKTSKDE